MEGNNPNATTEKITIDPEYFIQLAIQKEIPWKALALMLTDLTTTLDRSKQIIRVLVQELEKWVLNVENDSNHIVSDSRVPNEKVAKDQIQEDKENIIERGDAENLCFVDTDEPNYQPDEEVLDESQSDIQIELTQSKHSKTAFDFPSNKYYEFIANNEIVNTAYSDSEESMQMKDETILNEEIEVRHITVEDLDENGFEVQNEFLKHEQSKPEVDFPADEFYEFIGNNEKPNSVSFSNDETSLNRERHQIEKKNQCKICLKCFSAKGNKERHERTHTGEKTFQCQTCKMNFNGKGTLKMHERIHSGERPYKCKECNASFMRSGYLKTHERFHTEQNPFQCRLCQKRFTQEHNLKRHSRIHTGDKPFECKFCHKGFSQSGNLIRHKRIHTGEKPFQCQTCKKCFNDLGNLKNHERIHTDEKLFQCKT